MSLLAGAQVHSVRMTSAQRFTTTCRHCAKLLRRHQLALPRATDPSSFARDTTAINDDATNVSYPAVEPTASAPGGWQLFDGFVVPWDAVTAVLTTIQLFCIQIALGYGATPAVGNAFKDLLANTDAPPELGMALGAVASQVALLYVVNNILENARDRSNAELASLGHKQIEPTAQYRFDLSSVATALAVTALAIGAGLSVHALQMPEQARSSLEMAELVRGNNVATIAATGVATAVLAPVLEEKLYRGFVLGSLLSPICHLRVNVHLAVAIQATLFAASHVSLEAFPSLWIFGALLGYSFVASKGNLLVPTLAHCTFNGVVFAAICMDALA